MITVKDIAPSDDMYLLNLFKEDVKRGLKEAALKAIEDDLNRAVECAAASLTVSIEKHMDEFKDKLVVHLSVNAKRT